MWGCYSVVVLLASWLAGVYEIKIELLLCKRKEYAGGIWRKNSWMGIVGCFGEMRNGDLCIVGVHLQSLFSLLNIESCLVDESEMGGGVCTMGMGQTFSYEYFQSRGLRKEGQLRERQSRLIIISFCNGQIKVM